MSCRKKKHVYISNETEKNFYSFVGLMRRWTNADLPTIQLTKPDGHCEHVLLLFFRISDSLLFLILIDYKNTLLVCQ